MAHKRGPAWPFWRYIEDARLARRWSMRKLAGLSGIPATTITNLETSTKRPAPHIVHALADALGIDHHEAEAVAGWREPPTATQPVRGRARRQIEEADLDPDVRQLIINSMDFVDRYYADARALLDTPPPSTGDQDQTG